MKFEKKEMCAKEAYKKSGELLRQRDDVKRLMAEVCELYAIDNDMLLSDSRLSFICDARKLIIMVLRDNFGFTWQQTAVVLNRNHATGIHLYRGAQDLFDSDADFKLNYKEVCYRIGLLTC